MRSPSQQRARVLVVDDDDDLCELLRVDLSERGYAVATVRHGAAALELLRHHQPQVILLDLRMPIMDGWSFVELCRRNRHSRPAILLMSATKDIAESARRLGVDGHIAKPFDLEVVAASIARCLADS